MRINIELTAFFVGMYNDKKGSCLKFLIGSEVPKKVFLDTYNDFLKEEVFMPIELLIKEEKIKLVEKCRSTNLILNNERLTDAAKVLYTLEFISGNV